MAACKDVAKKRSHLNKVEQELRAEPPDFMTPPNVLETSVGKFWGIIATRPHMRTRFTLTDAMSAIHTSAGEHARLDHLLDMLRLCRGDNLGVRFIVP